LLNEAISLEDEQIDLGLNVNDERYNPEILLFEENNYQELKNKILGMLSYKEELIFILKEQNYTNKEISEITDNSLRTVYNIINRIKNKISNIVSN
jgi:DNA-directed RNA polymerase specialized sigma24 family protein